MSIRLCKKRTNLVNDARIKSCIARYDSGAHGAIKCGAYTRVQFLRAVSHSVGATQFLKPLPMPLTLTTTMTKM